MDEREKLIEAVREIRRKAAAEEAQQMTDHQLLEALCSELGLPAGTTFTDEQLEMIAKHR
jgi:hypothetical protein